MPTVKELEFHSYDANPDSSVRIQSLMKYFQEVAREDLNSYGITYNMMRDASQVFVIIKMKIEFKRKLNIYDNYILKTVPTKVSGIIFFRDFFLYDKENNLCAIASTSWVLMDFLSRRILRPSALIADVPAFPSEASGVVLSRNFKFSDCPISEKTNVRKVYYSNLDENNHFNNTETASFALDEVYDRIIDEKLEVETFEIHFNHESVLNDTLTIKTSDFEDKSLVSAINDNVSENAFDCLITYKNTEY